MEAAAGERSKSLGRASSASGIGSRKSQGQYARDMLQTQIACLSPRIENQSPAARSPSPSERSPRASVRESSREYQRQMGAGSLGGCLGSDRRASSPELPIRDARREINRRQTISQIPGLATGQEATSSGLSGFDAVPRKDVYQRHVAQAPITSMSPREGWRVTSPDESPAADVHREPNQDGDVARQSETSPRLAREIYSRHMSHTQIPGFSPSRELPRARSPGALLTTDIVASPVCLQHPREKSPELTEAGREFRRRLFEQQQQPQQQLLSCFSGSETAGAYSPRTQLEQRKANKGLQRTASAPSGALRQKNTMRETPKSGHGFQPGFGEALADMGNGESERLARSPSPRCSGRSPSPRCTGRSPSPRCSARSPSPRPEKGLPDGACWTVPDCSTIGGKLTLLQQQRSLVKENFRSPRTIAAKSLQHIKRSSGLWRDMPMYSPCGNFLQGTGPKAERCSQSFPHSDSAGAAAGDNQNHLAEVARDATITGPLTCLDKSFKMTSPRRSVEQLDNLGKYGAAASPLKEAPTPAPREPLDIIPRDRSPAPRSQSRDRAQSPRMRKLLQSAESNLQEWKTVRKQHGKDLDKIINQSPQAGEKMSSDANQDSLGANMPREALQCTAHDSSCLVPERRRDAACPFRNNSDTALGRKLAERTKCFHPVATHNGVARPRRPSVSVMMGNVREHQKPGGRTSVARSASFGR